MILSYLIPSLLRVCKIKSLVPRSIILHIDFYIYFDYKLTQKHSLHLLFSSINSFQRITNNKYKINFNHLFKKFRVAIVSRSKNLDTYLQIDQLSVGGLDLSSFSGL